MSVCIICHSETGNTRAVAERLAAALGGDLVGVKDLAGYSKVGMYLKGIPRAVQGKNADIDPAVIDVSAYDILVVGTPVWAGSPTPAINAGVAALTGIAGKPTIVFCTFGGSPGKTLETLKAMLAGRGADVRGAVPFTAGDARKGIGVEALADFVRRADGGMVVLER